MIRKTFIPLFFLILSLFNPVELFAQSTKKRLRTDSEINLFCRNLEPQNPYCLRWFEILQQRLEWESVIHYDIKNFCQENPSNPRCKKASKISIFTFCTQLAPENSNCIIWRNLKQSELEIKGILSEEIKRFCQKNPQNNLCRDKVK